MGGGASFQGADLRGANLSNANLDGATYNSSTIFPEGFTIPKDMIYQEDGESDYGFRERTNKIKEQYFCPCPTPVIPPEQNTRTDKN